MAPETLFPAPAALWNGLAMIVSWDWPERLIAASKAFARAHVVMAIDLSGAVARRRTK